MTLEELFDLVLNRTGEFLLGPTNVELDISKFETIVKNALKVYSKYKPKREKLQITLENYKYTFKDKVPKYITDVNPTFTPVYNPLLVIASRTESETFYVEWEYRKPTLYTNFNGSAEVEALFDYGVLIDEKGNKYIEVEEELFVDLVTAEFMIGLARSRRAFTLDELPVSTDAEILVSEALKMREDVLEQLQKSSILL